VRSRGEKGAVAVLTKKEDGKKVRRPVRRHGGSSFRVAYHRRPAKKTKAESKKSKVNRKAKNQTSLHRRLNQRHGSQGECLRRAKGSGKRV